MSSNKRTKIIEEIGVGAGTELVLIFSNRLFKFLGVTTVKACNCLEFAECMNRNGTNWCRININTIVRVLRKQYAAIETMIPFSNTTAKMFVNIAIRRADKKTLSSN